ncbi:Glycosyl hydrolases related to GH101 family, GHL1-GHL3 [Thermoactinomyces sp. DSM 45891]|uniref:glycoside hydrolase n=1 Tax=Thermoactinomyces sp. DSM 45891 TaxID=1761907 RepID=UPI000912C483|nr:glycoside hydrolase [Thermoactinomyces sp. DSM 45891]SFX42802.1 Glycosyl hydrolases related to GH101 family, GHL1-GHL3 [Thermoactinomyces sp. DSM 45891]
MKQKIQRLIIPMVILSLVITSVTIYYTKINTVSATINHPFDFQYRDFGFDANPETGEIFINKDGVKESASLPLPKQKVANLKKTSQSITWSYPDSKIDFKIEKKDHYLDIKLTSTGATEFEWPRVSADHYTLPLGEGKYIPSNDQSWKEYLKDEKEMSFSSNFSMRFFALNNKKYSIVYIAESMFNDTIRFQAKDQIKFSFVHEFPSINPKKEYGFRLYVTENNPVEIAQVYKNYVKEMGQFKTLQEKAKENPNIEKLYGAPHFYLWNDHAFTKENINFGKLKTKLTDPLISWIEQLLKQYTQDGSTEFMKTINQIKNQNYMDQAQKNTIVRSLNIILKLEQLYNKDIFQNVDEESTKLIQNGISHLSEQELYRLNKKLLKSVLTDSIDEIEEWGKKDTDMIQDMKSSGIKHAWIGLQNWANGLMNPDLVQKANQSGYLVGPYDSYHSIHDKKNVDWNTASFDDPSLYEQATITKKNGQKESGFLGKGRKLNPTLSLPSVKKRVAGILKNGIPFNSWFIDCDATGEVFDDYSPNHITTQEQDMKARLQRMSYIRDEKQMVIGSEGGNDFASSVISYAHGIETPVIKWGDPDMRENKTSPYYVGAYWSPDGSIPERYSKSIPIKSQYRSIYIDPVYSLPLYKLVYNDSVITSHHWEWGSLKIKNEVGNRMLNELLYNIPPLYHLDQNTWSKNKNMITSYTNAWSAFHKKAVTKPMTRFQTLSEDRLVQSTEFGEDMKVIVNYSNRDFDYNGEKIKPKTAVLYDRNTKKVWDVSKYRD